MTAENNPGDTEKKEKSRSINRRKFLLYGGAGVAGAAIADSLLDRIQVDEEVKAVDAAVFEIRSVVSGALLLPSPDDPIWQQAPEITVELLPQQATRPALPEQSVKSINIRSLNDGTSIAFRLEWRNKARNTLESIYRFRDAAAVMLPVKNSIPFAACMGAPGFPVNIFHWKASWQVDIDSGFQGVEASFPNYFNDVAPETILDPAVAARFYPGRIAGNPISIPDHVSPVEPLVAEGFGTTTSLKKKTAAGRGKYAEGDWLVVIQFPFDEGDDRVRLKPGTKPLALAVWDGGRLNVGGRKQWSNWGLLRIET